LTARNKLFSPSSSAARSHPDSSIGPSINLEKGADRPHACRGAMRKWIGLRPDTWGSSGAARVEARLHASLVPELRSQGALSAVELSFLRGSATSFHTRSGTS
jgi:hypothetical protein